ncbi:MAG: AMP-binding protein [Pseudomonadales bacterium]|nr:AMP-binding protein [Pseudomonadales bacterium]
MEINQTIIDIYSDACQKYSNNPIFSALGHTLSFQQLDLLSTQFAAYLQNQTTLKVGDRVAIQLPNLLHYPVVALGVLKAGLVLVNTNPLYTERELLHQLQDSGAKALVVLENFADTVANVMAETELKYIFTAQVGDFHPGFKRILLNLVVKYGKRAVPNFNIPGRIDLRRAIKQGEKCTFQLVQRKPEDLALLQYTGGTTGVAKGAMLSHGNLVANMIQACEHLPDVYRIEQDCIAAPLPLYHIYAFTMHVLCSPYTGNHSILIPNPRDISSVVKTFKDYPITCFIGLNTLYNALLHNAAFKRLNFKNLRNCSAGGMALTSDTATRWRELTGCAILEGYGLTEASPVVSSNQTGAIREGTIGTPVPGTEVKVVDDDGKALPIGTPGELWVKGPQIMLGYWRRPKETQNVLTEEGWLKTGDIAQIDKDGYIKIVDRKKDMILVSGFKVFPNEVEEVASMHPGVKECAAIGVPDENSGEVVKLVAVKAYPKVTAEEVRTFCRERLTGYKVPKHIEFVAELPKSNVGKILRRELK